VAVAAIGAVAAGLLSWTVVRATRSDEVTPVPPNALAMLSDRGLGGDPVPMANTPGAMASGAGSLWVADEANDAVVRVDPDQHRVVQTITGVGGAPQSIAVAQSGVWVAGARDGVVARINTATNRVVDKVVVGVQPAAVVAAADQVWVANSADNTVQRIDPSTGKADDPIRVGDGPSGLLLDGTTLWVANSRSGTVTRLDTRTGERLAADLRGDVGARGMAMTDTDVWVANELGQSVSRIDRTSLRVVNIPVEDGPSTVVVWEGSAWVNNAYSGTVSRIDVETNRVARINLQSAPRALVSVGETIWVATGAFGSPEHEGGTLVFTEYRADPGTLDPSAFGAPSRIAILRHVYDGLVSFRVTGGRGAEALVPDLAVFTPLPSDGGLIYTFTIRAGIRYSTGAEVKASDFINGLRRALANSGGSSAFDKVVGAQQCMAEPGLPGSCDLRGGADADDGARRLTIRLSEPDPDFLSKLAFSVVPTPAGLPLENLGLNAVVPGTGPYQFAAAAPDGNFTLSRNPYFAPWSFAAQPPAYPDRIEFRIAPSTEQAIKDVLGGAADVTTVSAADIGQLGAHAELLHPFENFNTDFAYFNGRIPPFDNRQARQALNYAVDRRTFVSLYGGGDGGADLSCQLLPSGFSAWRPYCPYQTGPATGPYQGPDLARARELVIESGTANVPITVRAYRGLPIWNRFPAYLADVLRSIGYTQVSVEDIPPEHSAGFPNDPAYASYQIFTHQGWLADYPSASTFYDLFSCRRGNLSGYCNPEIEAVAVKAATAAQTHPTLSIELWAQVDRMLTDDAAFVTLGSHHDASLVSPRVSNVMTRPGLGAVISQLWVK
jgi:peptide/nickel transport system substrate-binding protein